MKELRCFGCMKLKKGQPECEHCGYDERIPNAPHQLQPGTMLQNQYVVGRVLGQGGFGITYMGWDSFLEIPVAIKEYYPNTVVNRNAAVSPAVYLRDAKGTEQYTNNLHRFTKEARSLAKLGAEERLNNIVRVQNLVQANNTAYIIMEYVAGVDLREHMLRRGGTLTPRQTLEILLPLVSALDKIHAHAIIHRDISPDNIMVLPDGSAKLIDFGASHLSQMDDYGMQKSTEAIVKHGFAPMEQYSRKGHLGPWTDVYAMCATVYYCLTGQVLPPVMDRAFYGEEIDWTIVKGLSQGQLQALKDGLTLDTASRIQSMALLHERLKAAEEPEAEEAPEAEEPETEPQPEPVMEPEAETPQEQPPVSAITATEPVQQEVYTTLLTPEEQENFGIAPTVAVAQDWAQPAVIAPTVPVEAEIPVMEPTAPVEELPVIEPTVPVEEELPVCEEVPAEEPAVLEQPEEETADEPEESEQIISVEEPVAEPDVTEAAEEALPEAEEAIPEEVPEEETEPVIPAEEPAAEPEMPEVAEEALPEAEEAEPESIEEESALTPEEPRQEAPAAVAVEAPEVSKAPAKARGAKRKGKGKIWAAMAAVLVCVVGLAVGWMLMQGGETAPVITPDAEAAPDSWKENVLIHPYAGMSFKSWNEYKGQPIFGTEILNSQIRSVTFLDSLEEAPRDSWDVSAAGNKKVKAWVEENGGLYDLYIAAKGGINGGAACPILFAQFTQMEQIHFGNAFHTDEATDMQAMFYSCRSLEQMDLTGFATVNVTDMRSMFANCESLTALDLRSFDTANVTNMSHMFAMDDSCESKLVSLDVSSFHTGKVTAMNSMFSGCESLEALDITGFDTARVTTMNSMFSGCDSLKSLDVSSFQTGNVEDMTYLFSGCKKLTALDVTGFDTAGVTQMVGMFRDCRKLKTLDVNNFNTANVESMEKMFAGCKQLTALDLGSFDTANVGSMTSMFQDCLDITSLNVTGFDTTRASTNSMFAGCRSLQQVDLSSFYYSERFGIGSRMFEGCSSLMNVSHPKINEYLSLYRTDANAWRSNVLMSTYGGRENSVQNWNDLKGATVFGGNIRNDEIRSVTFQDAGSYGVPADSWDVSAGRNGTIGAYVEKKGELYDLYIVSEGGINARNCTLMFAQFTNLEQIHFNGMFHTEDATDMTAMFYGCRKLKELDLSDFKTGKVTSMHSMFLDCESLTELDLSGFDTARVNDMSQMFMMSDQCYSKLEELDLDGFDTSAVNHMSGMFRGLKRLKKLDLGSFNTGRVQNMSWMFTNCSNLEEVNVASFDTSRVTNMENMFLNCVNLTRLDLGNFQTYRVTDMSGMFYCCSKLTQLDVSNFNTASVTDMTSMFRQCSRLTRLELPGFNTASVRSMPYMFAGCESLTELDLSAFRLTGPPTMVDMFEGCRLTDVNHPQLNELLGG